eukprot:Skav233801  [mRNA]  locus=scaffold780:534140:536447:- [translate_table: standard]
MFVEDIPQQVRPCALAPASLLHLYFSATAYVAQRCNGSHCNDAATMARSMSLLPMVLLALGAWMLSSLTSQSGFVNTATPRTSKEFNKNRASDEFKKSGPQDKIESFSKVLQKFFDNEREDYKKDPEGHAHDWPTGAECECMQLDVAMKTPDYDALQKKASQARRDTAAGLDHCFGQVAYDFSLKRSIIEVDRDADRRWSFATDKMQLAADKGETFSDSAPLEDC